MRFFTPELYRRFNSADAEEADRADADWEAAVSGYRRHLGQIEEKMPDSVRELASLCLHDAELLNFTREPNFLQTAFKPFWFAVTILSVEQEGAITSLIYWLCREAKIESAPAAWPFSDRRVHWLYDELDAATGSDAEFVHRILLSDGRILEIPFVSALVHRVQRPLAESRPEPKIA